MVFKKGQKSWNIGKKSSVEHRRKISIANKGKHIERQKIIESKLNCKFMRINDFD